MIKTFRLKNGVSVVCETRPGTGLVSAHIVIGHGSAHEPSGQAGLTFLAQEATNGGTKTRTRQQIAEEMENRGSLLGTTTDRFATRFHNTAPAAHAAATFAIMADVVRNPSFLPAEIDKTKIQIAEALDHENENLPNRTQSNLFAAAFPGQPAGNNPMGAKDLLDSFTPAQVAARHAELLRDPGRIVLSFAGDITPAEAHRLAQAGFGDIPPAAAPAARAPVAFTGGDMREAVDAEQVNLSIAFPAPGWNDPARHAFTLYRELLSGGMSSPLFDEVRTKRNLVYSVHASYEPLETTGLFTISAGTGKDANEVLKTSIDLLGRTAREDFTPADLARARERILRNLEETLETADHAGLRNAVLVLNTGNVPSPRDYETALRRVTPDDVRRVPAAMLADARLALAAVGPQAALPSPERVKNFLAAQPSPGDIANPPAPSLSPDFAPAVRKRPARAAAATEPEMTILANGLRVVSARRPGLLFVGLWVGTGSDHEPPELNGAAHAIEHNCFFKTPTYGPGEIDRHIEQRLGGALNAETGNDKTGYYVYNLRPEALADAVRITGEIVFRSTLRASEFEGERKVIIEEIRQSQDDLSDRAYHNLMATAYPGQPQARPILGTEKTVGAMTPASLTAHRDAFYAPNNAVFVATGPISHKDFVKTVESMFGDIPAREFPPLPVPVFHGGLHVSRHPNAHTCDIQLAAQGVSEKDPAACAYDALASILGQGASSRLTQALVNERMITSEIGVNSNSYDNFGMFVISASAEAKNARAVISGAYAELRRLASDVTQAELDKAKIMLETSHLLQMESSNDFGAALAANTLVHGRPLSAAEELAPIRALTLDDVRAAARAVLASAPAATILAPKGTPARLLPSYAEIVEMKDGKQPAAPTLRPRRPGR